MLRQRFGCTYNPSVCDRRVFKLRLAKFGRYPISPAICSILCRMASPTTEFPRALFNTVETEETEHFACAATAFSVTGRFFAATAISSPLNSR